MLSEILALQLQTNKIDQSLLNTHSIPPHVMTTAINITKPLELALQPNSIRYTDYNDKPIPQEQIQELLRKGGNLDFISYEYGEKIIRKDKVFSDESAVQQYLSREFQLPEFDEIMSVKPGKTKQFGVLTIKGLKNQFNPTWRIEFSNNNRFVYELRKYSSVDNSTTSDLNLSRPHYNFIIKSTDGRPFNFNSRIKNVEEINMHLIY